MDPEDALPQAVSSQQVVEVTQRVKNTDAIDRKWLVLIAVGIGTFMSALDSSVVNIILPDVNRTFNSSITTIEWVVTIYLLIVSGTLLGFGRLGDLKGHKQVY